VSASSSTHKENTLTIRRPRWRPFLLIVVSQSDRLALPICVDHIEFGADSICWIILNVFANENDLIFSWRPVCIIINSSRVVSDVFWSGLFLYHVHYKDIAVISRSTRKQRDRFTRARSGSMIGN